MSSLLRTVVPWKAVLEPGEFVREQPRTAASDWANTTRVALGVAASYLVKFVLYTVPITIGWAAISPTTWDDTLLISGLAFLLLTLATLWWFHAGLILIGRSRGLLHSFQAVASSTGVYLAGAFGLAYPALVGGQGEVYETLRLVTYYGYFMDDTHLATGVHVSPLATAAGVVAVLYFWYSFFLAARLRYDATRIESLFVTGFAVVAPVTSVAGWAGIYERVRLAGVSGDLWFYGTFVAPVLLLVVIDSLRRRT